MSKNTTAGDIIFGYPPKLPAVPVQILGGYIYQNNQPGIKNTGNKSIWGKIKSRLNRTGVRASKVI